MIFEVVLCHWLPNWWTNQVMSACIYERSWSTFCDVTLLDWFLPVVMTVRNASSTQKSQQRVCSVILGCVAMVKTWRTHEILILWLSNLSTGVCGVVTGAKVHRMDFCLTHTIAEWSTLLKQNIWMKCLHAFGINRYKCKADVSCFCQYIS